MSVQNPNRVATKQDLANMYQKILPYLGGGGGGGSSSMNYSTDEQVIGTWVNGKPVYQRTLTGSLPSSFSGDEIVGTIANISEFISGIGSINVDNSLYQMTVPFVNSDTAAGLYKDGNNIRISLTNKSRFFGQSYAITICYTKTTD